MHVAAAAVFVMVLIRFVPAMLTMIVMVMMGVGVSAPAGCGMGDGKGPALQRLGFSGLPPLPEGGGPSVNELLSEARELRSTDRIDEGDASGEP